MIPLAYITQWRQYAPWPDDFQVEQDLILSRIITEIFSDEFLSKELAFRGGTALHKIFFPQAMRYSEDIDLVRTGTGSITPIIDALRNRLDPWLGKARTVRNNASFKLFYFFNPETSPDTKLRIKIEMNTRENFSVFGYSAREFSVLSSWYEKKISVNTYQIEELLATKLRALYQRKKGRDLFDIWLALKEQTIQIPKVMSAFKHYMEKEDNKVTRAIFEQNIDAKLKDSQFLNDIYPLLSLQAKDDIQFFHIDAADELKNKFLSLLD